MYRGARTRADQVTIVAHDIGPSGGMDRQVRELILGCLADDREVTVICRECDVPAHHRLRVHAVRGPNYPLPLAYPWFHIAALPALRRHRRGVVHTAGAILPVAVDLVTVHYCHRAFNQLGLASRARRDTRAHRLNARLAAAESEWGERWSYRPSRVRAVVAVSGGVRAEVKRCYPRLDDRLCTIPHGVDTGHFRPDLLARAATRRAWGIGPDALVALFVGGDWARKGLEHAIRAVAAAPAWRLVVVGLGDTARFAAVAATLGAADRVHFAGPAVDAAPTFAGADAFLLPTTYETFSLVTYEAAATGLPLLVTRVHGPDDLVHDGVNGYFIDGDPQRTARRLDALGASAAVRAAMGAAARRSAAPFTWEAAVASYLQLYDRLAEPR